MHIPIHPCCYCGKTEAGYFCTTAEKVECFKFLNYIQQLNRMKAQKVLISELKHLLEAKKGGK
jgi:hypothetical protein